ncbi:VaFE repeat-containing surface-anchored protein [Corynebacterium sp. Marseille-Q2516]
MHPPTAKADETNGYGEAVTGWTAITPEGAPAKPNAQGQLEGQLVATRDGKQGYGWCIDFGIHNPTKAPKNIKYTGPVRLTHVKPLYTREIAQVFNYGDKQETARGVDLNQDKDRRNVMIHLVKELKKAQKRGDTERASKLARSLQLVTASFYETNKQALQYTYNGVRQYGWNLNNAEFEQLTGYKVAKGEDSQYFLEHTGKANPPIPEAAPDEYLTIISPTEYRLDKVRPSEAQRLITIDQPGLKIGPEIGTKAAFKGENHQVKAGAVITDTVSYKNLAVGKEYTLNAKLVDKKDASRVLGEATKTFKTPATNTDGEVMVDIPVKDDVTTAVESAVVFETLTSTAVDKDGAPTTDGAVREIAKHEDINDDAQTVTTEKKVNAFKPAIGTVASWENGKFGNDRVPSVEGKTGKTTVFDRVKIDNIAPDKTYKLTGVLHKKNAEGGDGGAIDGATASREFTSAELEDAVTNEKDGSVSGYLVLEIPGGDKVNAGESAVVFETLTSKVVDKEGNDVEGDKDQEIAKHENIGDAAQTVTVTKKNNAFVPNIGTEASWEQGKFGNDRVASMEGETGSATVYDRVKIDNIAKDKTYKLTGVLHKKNADGTDGGAIEGATASREFTHTDLVDSRENKTEGSYSGYLVLEIPGGDKVNAGESAVVFEKLTSTVVDKAGNDIEGGQEQEIAKHENIGDASQTVTVTKPRNAFEPRIGTEASWENGRFGDGRVANVEGATGKDVVYDNVYVENIAPDKEYKLIGELHKKNADGTDGGVIGTSEPKTFTSADLDGEQNKDGSYSGYIVIEVPGGSKINAGESGVVFETLTSAVVDKEGNDVEGGKDQEIAKHHDITDEDQTVSVTKAPNAFVPKIGTEASWENGKFGDERVSNVEGETGKASVFDRVKIENIAKDKTYKLTGVLHKKNADGGDGGAIEGATASREFTSAELEDSVTNEKDGSVSGYLVLEIPGADKVKAGESAVAFEKLTSTVVDKAGNDVEGGEEQEIAKHENIEDAAQTVTVTKKPNAFEPKIKTEAFFDEGLTQKTAEGEAPSDFVYDKVSVSNIVPGKEYALAGELMSKAEDGKKLGEGSVTFTDAELKDRVENADGSVSGSIVLKVSGAKSVKAGESAVVFETLTSKVVDKQGNETPGNEEPKTVAEHKDPNDEDQIVSVTKPEPTESTTPEATTEETPTESTTPEDGGVVPPPSVTEEETTPEISDEPTESTTPESPVESTTPDECATESTTPGKPGEPGEGESTTPGKPGEGESTTPGKPGEPGEGTTTEECEPSESTTPDKPKAEPKIGTRADFAKDSKTEVVAGATIIDNVEYTGLVGGKEYTLNAQLVDKTDASKVLGTGSVTFTPGSADGDVDVTITVDESVTEPVEAAVAFETLTSKVVDKDGNDVEGDKDQEIAKHHDIDDPNQTVISKRPTESTTPEATTEESPTESTTPEETSPESPVESTTPEETSPESPVESTTPESPAASTTPEEGGVVPPPSVTEEETTPGVSGESTTPESPVESTTPDECATESTTPGKPGEPGEGESTTPGKPGEGESTTPGKPGEPGEGTTTEECEPSESTTPDKPKAEPKIGTRAEFAKDSKTEVVAGATIIDNVEYTGLVGGKEYTLNAQLVDKTDASKVLGTGSVTFTPGSADGDVDVTITVDESVTEPVEAAVAFETLTSKVVDKQGNETPGNTEDTVIAEHKDINDDNQTVISKRPTESTTPESPAASTTPGTEEPGPAPSKTEEETTPGVSGESTTPESPVESTTPDECATESTTPGKPGEPGEGESTTPGKPGEPGEGTTTEECEPSESTTPGVSDESTTPDEPGKPGGGESTTPGKPGVPGKPGSEEPSKKTPKISTSAHIEGDGVLAKGAKVVDTVTFTNLVPGKKYVLNGELMCKAGGKSTGATGTVTFVPFKEDGSVNLTIEVTDGDCAEQVVFETLRDRDGNVVAIHHDINDAAQTVTAKDALKPGPKETPKDKNVNVVVNKKPDNGKPSEPKAERRPIKSVPSGSLQWVPGMEVAI